MVRLKGSQRIEPEQQRKMMTGSPASRTTSTPSPSEVDRAIITSLTFNSGFQEGLLGRCQVALRGDSITKNGKRKQMCRMIGVVLIPIALLCGMTANTFIASLDRYISTTDIRQYLFYSLEVGNLIHRLQAERDRSCLYVSNFSSGSKQGLLKVYPETDKAIENMSFWTVAPNQSGQFGTKDKLVMYLNQHRYSMDSGNNIQGEIDFYSNLIDVFISWQYEAVSESQTGIVWKSLVAYQEIILAKEATGKERSLGGVFYAKGGFPTRADYLQFAEAHDVANVTFTSAFTYSPAAEEYFNAQIEKDNTSNTLSNVDRMRQEIKRGYISPTWTIVEQIDFWYSNMTKYLDSMLEMQRSMSRKIDTILNEATDSEMLRLLSISTIFAIVVLLSPAIAFAVYRLTSDIQMYSGKLVDRQRDLVSEKHRTDSLLHQMLPKAVSRQLRHNNVVKAEMFEECTVCFSDIHGFTKMCSTMSPKQVVDMLGILNTHIDALLARHDVYKVETIGDAYMIASGVPVRNGKAHAREIIQVALDILEMIEELENPQIIGRRVKMRLGCHTGNVVAGVVGVKMPRYSLHGETVQIANRMEALGKPNMIHISQTTHDTLMEIGCNFTARVREDDAAQNDAVLLEAFHGTVRTYWLMSDDQRVVKRTRESIDESGED